MLVESLAALCLSLTPPASTDAPVRAQRRFGIGLEGGWNSLSGVGLALTYNALPRLAIDGGLGVGLAGFKLGARARYNFVLGRTTPFVAAGMFVNTGISGETSFSTGAGTFLAHVGPAPFVQAVFGGEWLSRVGIFARLELGYALRLGNDVTYVIPPAANERAAAETLAGSGPVAALAIGYMF